MNTNDVLNKLIAEIERRMTDNCELGKKAECFSHRAVEDNDILALIDSLQQEQPEKLLTFGGFVDKVGTWFAHLRLDKFRKTFDGETFPATELVQRYDWFVRELSKQYSDKQEQPEVDIRKELDRLELMGSNDARDIQTIARHFYELGLNARKEK